MNSLRDVCKRNKEAKEIALRFKDEGLLQVYRRLRENGLSTRGLTKELMERLAGYDMRYQIPGIDIEWDNVVDLDTERELDSEDRDQRP